MKELVTAVTDVTHESTGTGEVAASQEGAPSKTGRRAIVRVVSVVGAWRRQEDVSWA